MSDDATTPADQELAAARITEKYQMESVDLPIPKPTFSDLLKLTIDQYDYAIKAETMAWLNSPFYKIMRQRNAEIRLLYGTMSNYFLVMDYKPQPEGAA